jgi:hypothetical protein
MPEHLMPAQQRLDLLWHQLIEPSEPPLQAPEPTGRREFVEHTVNRLLTPDDAPDSDGSIRSKERLRKLIHDVDSDGPDSEFNVVMAAARVPAPPLRLTRPTTTTTETRPHPRESQRARSTSPSPTATR